MTAEIRVQPVADDAALEAVMATVSHAFEFPREYADQFAQLVGRDAFRAVHVNGELAGGLSLIAMGQYFGGRAVPMTGISTVAIEPHHRARGAATELMEEAVRELHADGVALSALYPATQTLYRRSGYEQAGARWALRLPLDRIRLKDRSLAVIPIEGEADEPLIQRLYTQRAMENAGNLDRRHFNWARIKSRRGVASSGYLIGERGDPQGYFYVAKGKSEEKAFSLELRDFAVMTDEAARRLLTFLADHETMADVVTWFGAAFDPLLQSLPEPAWKANLNTPWMLRIVHVPHALTRRGYPRTVTGAVHLDIHDALIPGNHGRFLLRIADGEPVVEPGGHGEVQLDIRGLAGIYSGYRTPMEAKRIGLAHGDDEALHAMATMFAGPPPFMSDMF